MRSPWAAVASDVCAALAPFDPTPIGTPPLGLDGPDSDIDIACHAADLAAFADHLWDAFATFDDFSLHQWREDGRPVIAAFRAQGWSIEVFGAATPVAEQTGYRHFVVERRLLGLGGAALRAAVQGARRSGAKTEPAFAAVLGLAGDPYRALLDLGTHDDAALGTLIDRALRRPAEPGETRLSRSGRGSGPIRPGAGSAGR